MTNLKELLIRCKRISCLYFCTLSMMIVFIVFIIVGISFVVIFPVNGSFAFLVVVGGVMLLLSVILMLIFPIMIMVGNFKLNRIRELIKCLKEDESLSRDFRELISNNPIGAEKLIISSFSSFSACKLLVRYCTDELNKKK